MRILKEWEGRSGRFLVELGRLLFEPALAEGGGDVAAGVPQIILNLPILK